MDIPKFNTVLITAKNVLVAPLDCGLGHVTRCIPVINALLKRGNTVIIAATGPGRTILAAEFPGISIIDLPQYRVRLAGTSLSATISLLCQLPRLWRIKNKERRWLKNLCLTHPIDLIISDNRYGLYHNKVHSVFITHQLFIRSGFGERFDRRLMRWHYRLIGKFSECWVPDNASPGQSLAGRLSHPPLPASFPVTYIGLLSRFAAGAAAAKPEPVRDSLIVILSGPEPRRSEAEAIIRMQLVSYKGPVLLVRGLPGEEQSGAKGEAGDEQIGDNAQMRVAAHLPAAEMRRAILSADRIVCRSGYSTLMDLMALRRAATLIPTPGQPEQEYLAEYMNGRGWMKAQQQKEFSLQKILTPLPSAGSGEKNGDGFPELYFFNGDLPALTLRKI